MKLWRLWKANKQYTRNLIEYKYHQGQVVKFGSEMSSQRLNHHIDLICYHSGLMEKAKEELLK